MTISIRKLTSRIGAEVTGVDLSRPLDAETIAAIRQALNAHKALVFDGADLDAGPGARRRPVRRPHRRAPDGARRQTAARVLDVDGEKNKANEWHTDVTFVVNPPAISTLRSIVIPPYGGETLIANSAAAPTGACREPLRLSSRTPSGRCTPTSTTTPSRARDAKAAEAAYRRPSSRPRYETAHPVVRVHPETGERGLFIGGFVRGIDGLSDTESRDVLRLLQAHVTRPEHVLRWSWKPGQLLVFDNRITQHYAIDNYDDQPRQLSRVTVAGDVPVSVERRAQPCAGRRLLALLGRPREEVGGMSTVFAPARVRPPRLAAAPSRERATETFTASAGRARVPAVRRVGRVSWPLGIYTTPVVLFVLWEVVSRARLVAGERSLRHRPRSCRPAGTCTSAASWARA